jgi:hypothetical protein
MRPYETQRYSRNETQRYNCIPSPRKKHEKSFVEELKELRGRPKGRQPLTPMSDA